MPGRLNLTKKERQRRLVVWISGLALVAHLLLVLSSLHQPDLAHAGMGSVGVLLMGGLLWVNRQEHHAGRTLTLALLLNLGWLVVDGRQAILGQLGLTAWVQNDVLFMTLLCYAFLPLRLAHARNAVFLLLLVVVALLARAMSRREMLNQLKSVS